MLLHLVRHADAGNPETWTGADAARPLSEKGRAQAERLGAFLADLDFRSDEIITSPKLRAAQTAEIVASHLGMVVTTDSRLGDPLDLPTLDAILTDAGDPERPMLFGHDPDFSDFVADLCGASKASMRKGALAKIEIDRPLRAGGGTLRWLIPPDALRPKG
jgi:phosphohistidine phosphatase SixA